MTGARPTPAPVADPWREVSAARIQAAQIAVLAPVRDQADVRVVAVGDAVWVRWPAGRLNVVRCLLPVHGIEFFVSRDGKWFRFGSRLPTADAPPSLDGKPVASLLAPARIEPILPGSESVGRVVLRVVRGGGPKPVTALTCRTTDLAAWADRATTAELAAVTAARSGERAVLLGNQLPSIRLATRLWGTDLLVPVGFRPDPDLSAADLRAAIGIAADELGLLDEAGAEVIPRNAFEPLTRAGVRLALRGPLAEDGVS